MVYSGIARVYKMGKLTNKKTMQPKLEYKTKECKEFYKNLFPSRQLQRFILIMRFICIDTNSKVAFKRRWYWVLFSFCQAAN